jgi:ribosomal protein S13
MSSNKDSKELATSFMAYSTLKFDDQFDPNQIPGTGLPITGFAIHDGTFKDIIQVDKSEFSNIQKSLQTAQFRVDHSESVRDVVGLVKQAKVDFDENAGKSGVSYDAFIDDAEIAGKVQKGYVKDVSIGFDFYPECTECGGDFRECEHWFDEAQIRARDVDVFELSLVTRGADAEASASVKTFKAQFDKKLKHLKKEEFKLGGNSMVKDETVIDASKLVEELSAAQKEKLAKEAEAIKFKKEADEKEAANVKLMEQLKALQDEKDSLETTVKTQATELNKQGDDIKEIKATTKKVEVLSLVDEEIEKGLCPVEEKDSRVKELMGKDDLSETKRFLGKFSTVKTHKDVSKSKIGLEGFGKLIKENGQLDFANITPELKQKYIHQMFRYDRVRMQGGEYMGFYKNDEVPERSYQGSYLGFYKPGDKRLGTI